MTCPGCRRPPCAPFSEKQNRCHLPGPGFLSFCCSSIIRRGPLCPFHLPSLPQPHPSLCFGVKGASPPAAPHQHCQRPGGSREGQRLPGWSMGWGWLPAKGPAAVTVGSVFTVCPQVFYMVNNSYLPIKDFSCSVGITQGRWGTASGEWEGTCECWRLGPLYPGFAPSKWAVSRIHTPGSSITWNPSSGQSFDPELTPPPVKSLAHPIPLGPSHHPFGSIALHCVSLPRGQLCLQD